MGCENIYEDDIDAEKSILDIMKSANYEKLRIALDKDDATSWQGVLDSMKYTSLSESDQQKIADTIKKDNTDARTTLSKMM